MPTPISTRPVPVPAHLSTEVHRITFRLATYRQDFWTCPTGGTFLEFFLDGECLDSWPDFCTPAEADSFLRTLTLMDLGAE